MRQRLGEREWIVAGLRMLADHGVDAVRVEPLAANLKVTKGSFYWHFKDRNALLEALLQAWKARATNDIIVEVEGRGADARTRLHALFEIAFNADGRLDRAVRTWAAKDAAAAAVLEDIDCRRVGYVAAQFQSLGCTPQDAAARARFVYLAVIGHFATGAHSSAQVRSAAEFGMIFQMLTGEVATRDQEPPPAR